MARLADKHEDKKRELLNIAEKLFIEKGYKQTSIEDILTDCGISKGGFYHYFKSKDEVLYESINGLIDKVLIILQDTVSNDSLNALDKLNIFLSKKNKFQKEKKEYARLLGTIMQTNASQYIYYSEMSRKLVPLLAQIIQQGVDESIFDVEFPEETAEIITRIISSVVQSASYDEYTNNAAKHDRYISSVQTLISRALGLKTTIKLY